MTLLVLVFAATAFTLSACVGLGGSLILVPALSLLLGVKSGIALAGLLLAANNIAKIIAYRRTIPLRAAAGVVIATGIGAWIGARILIVAPAEWIGATVIAVIAVTFLFEQSHAQRLSRASAPPIAFLAGLTSGVAGTSGPLKGVALRGLTGDRQHLAGAASVVSAAADITKTAVYLSAALLDSWTTAAPALMLIPFTTALGYRLNREIGERAYRLVFWSVMVGYSVRLFALS